MTPVHTIYLSLPNPDESEVRKYARCPSGANAEIQQCINEMRSLRGSFCYCECAIHDSGGVLDMEFAKTNSKDLRKALSGCEKIILFAATVGLLPDRLLAKYAKISPAKALLLQAVGTERIEAACDAFCSCMKVEYLKQNNTLKNRFSPGYGDLPLTLQKDIFSVLDCSRQIGLTLSDSLLMMPSKSVTAIIGIEQNKQENFL